MKIIDTTLLDQTTRQALQSPRRRMNYNFHEKPDDPVNRLLNAMEPGTYVRPHRHLHPEKEEMFLVLRGRVAVFTFDGAGGISEVSLLDPAAGRYGAEIKAGVWHGLLVLDSGTVIYEVKKGPYTPLAADDLAPWSPAAEDEKGVRIFLEKLEKEVPGV